jgi:D-galactosamine 6-phosphate deaminase/isomerase
MSSNMEISTLRNPLLELLNLPATEKFERGLEHTPGEIHQQPETWKTTYQRCQNLKPEIAAAIRHAGIGRGSSSPIVYLVGAGTSDYIGRALAPLLRRRWGAEVWPVPSTTLLADLEEFHRDDRDYLWISFSRSGQSPEGVALLQQTLERHRNIRHLVITCNQHGQMAALCARHPDCALAIILDETANDRGLAMTSSFTNMLVAGQCVANVESLEEYGAVVTQMAEVGERFLPAAAEVAVSVTALGCCRVVLVGSGALHAVAQECVLKLVELSAGTVVAMAETPLGLRHGPMSSFDQQTLFVTFLSSDSRRRGYELDLLDEISRKRLSRFRIAVTANGAKELASLTDYPLSLNCPGFVDEYRPAVDVILGQLLGLFASLRSGLKPDHPSPNGAISRVVAPIKLYS